MCKKYMHSVLIILSLIYGNLYSETIDEYVNNSNDVLLWSNVECAIMSPVKDLNDFETIFRNAFENCSLNEGKPKYSECKIIESKRCTIHNGEYLVIRYNWKAKDRLMIIKVELNDGKWLVR